MKRILCTITLATVSLLHPARAADPLETAVIQYFDGLFTALKTVADRQPSHDTFRDAMRPVAESVDGFFGGTLINTDFVIDQSYYKFHALANGFDLKKVKELDYFWDRMRKAPAPQLSEPGHGNIMQPRLIAMRYPVIVDGELKSIVSMMVKTEAFLKATGLDQCKAFRITCLGKPAEEQGKLSDSPQQIRLTLPSTEWVIQYDR